MGNYANVLMRKTLFMGRKEKVVFDMIRDASQRLNVEPPRVLFYRLPRVKSGRYTLAYHRDGTIYVSEQALNQPSYKLTLLVYHEYWHYYSRYLHKGGSFAELILTNSRILEEVMADSFSMRTGLFNFKLEGGPKRQKKVIKKFYLGRSDE